VNRHHYHRRAFARLSDLGLIDAADFSSQHPSNDRFAFSHSARRQAFVSTPLSWKRIMRLVTAAVGTFIGVLGTTVHAQDLEPRAYSNSPIGLNFVIAGYGYASGTVLTDPSLPLENVSNESHVGVIGFATTFAAFGQSGQFGLIVPYASLAAKGLVFGLPRARHVDGFADPAFRFSMNFVGAPALKAAEFKDYRQDFIFGMSLRVTAPLGQYDEDKLVNIGTNRWSFKPEIGFSKAFGPWTVELAPGTTFYTDNSDFFGGRTREVAPLYSVQSGVSYTFAPGGWFAFNAGYFKGGRTTVDEVESNDEQEGIRFGATLALPVNRYHSVKLYSISGYHPDREHDFQAFGIAWQYRWGGGF
jgi:Putative MetA-pathway of phenol degradation